MKLDFNTNLKDDDIDISFDLKPNQQIIAKECTIRWHLNPQIQDWGVRYWRMIMDTFVCKLTIQNIGEEQHEFVVIDSLKYYDMEILYYNYEMHMDFCINKIDINRRDKRAIAYING